MYECIQSNQVQTGKLQKLGALFISRVGMQLESLRALCEHCESDSLVQQHSGAEDVCDLHTNIASSTGHSASQLQSC